MQTTDKFQSARLVYRGFQKADLDVLAAMYTTHAVQLGIMCDWVVPRPEASRDMLAGWTGCALFATVVEKDSGRVVGSTWIRVQFPCERAGKMGIVLAEEFWGKGYGTEVMRWTVEREFEGLGLHRLALGVFEPNEHAIAVHKKVGFVEEARNRQTTWIEGRWWDLILMSILEDEYWATKQKGDDAY